MKINNQFLTTLMGVAVLAAASGQITMILNVPILGLLLMTACLLLGVAVIMNQYYNKGKRSK